MSRQLRAGKGRNGLILANGGVATYQHVLCLSTAARPTNSPYPLENPLPETITDVPVPPIADVAEGEAVIEVRETLQITPSPVLTAHTDIHRRVRPGWQADARPRGGPTQAE